MENNFDVAISATVDYIKWTCPKCGQENEGTNSTDTCCTRCDYDISNDIYVPDVLDDVITGWYDDIEED